jgi:hypothetical protein
VGLTGAIHTVLLAAAVIFGCAVPAAEGREPTSLLDQAAAAQRDLLRRFGDGVRILSIELGPGVASFAVQDPGHLAHVDLYTYRDGALAETEPLAVGRNHRQVRARLFNLRDVDLTLLPGMVSAAPAAVGTEDGRVRHLVLERSQGYNSESSWGRPRWRVHVEGSRGGGSVEYGLDGKRGRVVRW